ncbi:MAG TPA: hypothetical protein VKV28_14725 [Candidatus Binataceae bacterium]|nr:hypothetical protein [Candidatus Binataceae bacterium]
MDKAIQPVPLKRAGDTAARASGAIERFIERTLGPRLEELTGEVRGLRSEMQQLDKRLGENLASLRNELQAELRAVRAEMEATWVQLNPRIDALSQRLDDALNIRERLVAIETKLAARNN